MRDALIVNLLSLVPRSPLARGMGAASRLRPPAKLQRWILDRYVRHYEVDLDEIEGNLEDYPTLAAFFVRGLTDGARPICADADAVVSPCDARVIWAGTVQDGTVPQGGPHRVDLPVLLGGDHPFEGGECAVLYLAPPDYHRVHVPREGRVVRWTYLPGRLFPVFPASAERIPGLFAKNERTVTWFEGDAGLLAVVMVGAFGVGRIEMTFTDLLTNAKAPAVDVHPDPIPVLERGVELGRFHLGSTVILCFLPGRVHLDLRAGDRVRVGARIGTLR
ncbi:MAG: phosphatidylserine decarboxylase [Deltaproteobacteria bacterium]|nr:phosphatidylserine decarboxylase [Deltaproteobacteria bacterium]